MIRDEAASELRVQAMTDAVPGTRARDDDFLSFEERARQNRTDTVTARGLRRDARYGRSMADRVRPDRDSRGQELGRCPAVPMVERSTADGPGQRRANEPAGPPSDRASLDGRGDVGECPRCVELGRTCPACVQRRYRAWRLVDVEGMSEAGAAARMGLTAAAVRALVAHERDRRDVHRFKLDSIPTARVRAFLERELGREPELTRAEVARRMEIDPADFDRQLGYAPAKNRSGATQERVGIPLASRLTLALGRDPHELEGC